MSIEAAALELGCDAEELRREVDAVPSGAALQPAVRETEEAA
jgi:hypothetical protein